MLLAAYSPNPLSPRHKPCVSLKCTRLRRVIRGLSTIDTLVRTNHRLIIFAGFKLTDLSPLVSHPFIPHFNYTCPLRTPLTPQTWLFRFWRRVCTSRSLTMKFLAPHYPLVLGHSALRGNAPGGVSGSSNVWAGSTGFTPTVHYAQGALR